MKNTRIYTAYTIMYGIVNVAFIAAAVITVWLTDKTSYLWLLVIPTVAHLCFSPIVPKPDEVSDDMKCEERMQAAIDAGSKSENIEDEVNYKVFENNLEWQNFVKAANNYKKERISEDDNDTTIS